MTDEFKGVKIAPFKTFAYGSWRVKMEALLRAKALWKCTQVLASLSLKEKDEIETNLDKALGTVQCFLDPTYKEIDQGRSLPKMSGRNSRISWKGKNFVSRLVC
jgi:hypothetical protein